LAGVHNLGHDGHVVLVADVAEDLEALFAHPLEGVGGGSRLERPAPQDVRPSLLHVPGDTAESFKTLDGARARDHGQASAADPQLADGDDGVVLLELPAGELERLEDAEHLLNPGDRLERLGLGLALVADDPDDRTVFATADVRAEPGLLDPLNDMGDLRFG